MVLAPWWIGAACALLALVAIYAYAAAALFAHAQLARIAPPRSLAGALLAGALIPACGCTAFPHARRAPPRLRAPFLIAAYAANPLLILSAALLRGWLAAATVLVLALAFAATARLLPEGERPRTRLDDLLLRRNGRPLRDAAPYTLAFAAPALGVGALVGLGAALAPDLLAGLTIGALALLFAPRRADVADDHGAPFARRVRALFVAFALASAVAVALL